MENESAAVRIRAFGPLSARVGAQEVALGPLKQRTLLGVLLCRTGAQVLSGELVDALWTGSPPASASGNLRTYVHGLRRTLGSDVIGGSGRTGYRIDPELVRVDAWEFDTLCADAEAARRSGNLVTARAALRRATALRQGPAYADVSHVDPIAPEAARLEEAWLLAVEQRVSPPSSPCGPHESISSLANTTGIERPTGRRSTTSPAARPARTCTSSAGRATWRIWKHLTTSLIS